MKYSDIKRRIDKIKSLRDNASIEFKNVLGMTTGISVENFVKVVFTSAHRVLVFIPENYDYVFLTEYATDNGLMKMYLCHDLSNDIIFFLAANEKRNGVLHLEVGTNVDAVEGLWLLELSEGYLKAKREGLT